MSDNDIIKALECCTGQIESENACAVCPFINSDNCMMGEELALDLIKRQKAEIEVLSSKARRYEKYYFNHEYDKLEADAIRRFAERLYNSFNSVGHCNMGYVRNEIKKALKEIVGAE